MSAEGGFGWVDDSGAGGLFAGGREKGVRVDEACFDGRVEKIAQPARSALGTEADRVRDWEKPIAEVVVAKLQAIHVRDPERATSYFLSTAAELTVVYQRVAEHHNVLAHAVLMCQVGDGLRVHFRKQSKEADVQTTFLRFLVTD